MRSRIIFKERCGRRSHLSFALSVQHFQRQKCPVRFTQHLTPYFPRIAACEPLCGLLRGRVASLPQRRILSRFWANLSKIPVRRKRSRRKALALFRANAHSQQPAVRAAARVCGFWKLTLFSRFPERFDAKFEKSRRKAPCHNGLRRRFDRKSVRFIPL